MCIYVYVCLCVCVFFFFFFFEQKLQKESLFWVKPMV